MHENKPIAEAEIGSLSATWIADAHLAATDARTPEAAAARNRVITQFFSIHLPERPPTELAGLLRRIDLAKPVVVVNAADGDIAASRSPGVFAGATAPDYLLGERLAPRKPGDIIYALKLLPLG